MKIQCRSTVIITFPVDKLFKNSLNIRRVKLHYAKKKIFHLRQVHVLYSRLSLLHCGLIANAGTCKKNTAHVFSKLKCLKQ